MINKKIVACVITGLFVFSQGAFAADPRLILKQAKEYFNGPDDFLLRPRPMNQGELAGAVIEHREMVAGLIEQNLFPLPAQGAANQSSEIVTSVLHADLNGDGQVDLKDLSVLTSNYSAVDAQRTQGDLTGDGRINLVDLIRLRNSLGEVVPTGTFTINGNNLFTNDAQLNLFLDITDNHPSDQLTMAFSVDGGTSFTDYESFVSNKQLSLLGPDGLKEIRVRIQDVNGNLLELKNTITLDTQGPQPSDTAHTFEYLEGYSDPSENSNSRFYGENIVVNDSFLAAFDITSGFEGSLELWDIDPASPTYNQNIGRINDPTPTGSGSVRFGFTTAMTNSVLAVTDDILNPVYTDGEESLVYIMDVRRGSPTFGQRLLTISDPTPNPPLNNFGALMQAQGNVLYVKDTETSNQGVIHVFNIDPLSPSFGAHLGTIRRHQSVTSSDFASRFVVQGEFAYVRTLGADNRYRIEIYVAEPGAALGFFNVAYADPSPSSSSQFADRLIAQDNFVFARDLDHFGNLAIHIFHTFPDQILSPRRLTIVDPLLVSPTNFGWAWDVNDDYLYLRNRLIAGGSAIEFIDIIDVRPESGTFGDLLSYIQEIAPGPLNRFGNRIVASNDRFYAFSDLTSDQNIVFEFQARPFSITINDGDAITNSNVVTLKLDAHDNFSTNSEIEMSISVDGGINFTSFQQFQSNLNVTLPAGDGLKKIVVKYRDLAGNIAEFFDTIFLNTLQIR